MLSKRVIPCLDVRNGKLTKGIKFAGNVDIGDPVESARKYYEEGADEIVFYDITASAEDRGIFLDVVERVAANIFIPFSVGGGIRSVADMRAVLLAGAEKISINSAAVQNPRLISEGADAFGSQAVVVGMDWALTPLPGRKNASALARASCVSIPLTRTAQRMATSLRSQAPLWTRSPSRSLPQAEQESRSTCSTLSPAARPPRP